MAQEVASIRLMLASLRCMKGDWEANLEAHLRVLQRATDEGCQLVVFPEMSLTGSVDSETRPQALLDVRSKPVETLARSTQLSSLGVVFGIAERGEDGEAHIAQIYACNGRLAGSYRKRHLGEGDEPFTPSAEGATFLYGSLRFGIAICAEGKVDYPFDEPVSQGAKIVFFLRHPDSTDVAPTKRAFGRGWNGGSPKDSVQRVSTLHAPASGSRSSLRQAPRWTRTSQDSPRSSPRRRGRRTAPGLERGLAHG